MITNITRRSALGLLVASGTAAGLPSFAATSAASPLLDDMAWRLLDIAPEQATSLGVDTGTHAELRTRLEDRSAGGQARKAAMLRGELPRIEAALAASPDEATRTSLLVVRTAYRTALDGFALPYGDVAVGGYRNTPYVVIQNVGAYIDVPRFLGADHPVHNVADAEAYLARLQAMPAVLDGETARLRESGSRGLIAPDFLLDKAIAQMRATLADARGAAGQGGGTLVESLTKRTAAIPGDWSRRASAIVKANVGPALQRQLAELRRQRAQAISAPGINVRPDGAAFYAWALRASTTTTRSADEIHRQGLDELAALQARMEPILRGLGYTSGTVGARMAALSNDARFKFPEGDPGRAEILAEVQRRLTWIRAQLPRAFQRLVRGNLEVRRLPLAEEPGAPVAYGGSGSIDGSIPGKIWINLGSTDLHRRYGLPTLVHHEGIPGHVWQGEYANQLPLIRSMLQFNAYSEGWALYAEQLGDELGAYDDDPVGRLGYLQSLAFRACRMVVDTGIHAKGWSRAQGLDFFLTQNGNTRAEMESEIDRYCSWPGQACGYKVGHSEILRLRQRTTVALGDRYDLRGFDQIVVEGGNVPLDVLATIVDRAIASA